MNKLENAKVLVIGGAGFIGSFVVRELLKEPVKEVIIYDNFTRGKMENIDDCLKNGDIALVINTSDNRSSKNDAKLIRQTVLRENIPYFTTLSATEATVAALKEMKKHKLEICSLQEYLSE